MGCVEGLLHVVANAKLRVWLPLVWHRKNEGNLRIHYEKSTGLLPSSNGFLTARNAKFTRKVLKEMTGKSQKITELDREINGDLGFF